MTAGILTCSPTATALALDDFPTTASCSSAPRRATPCRLAIAGSPSRRAPSRGRSTSTTPTAAPRRGDDRRAQREASSPTGSLRRRRQPLVDEATRSSRTATPASSSSSVTPSRAPHAPRCRSTAATSERPTGGHRQRRHEPPRLRRAVEAWPPYSRADLRCRRSPLRAEGVRRLRDGNAYDCVNLIALATDQAGPTTLRRSPPKWLDVSGGGSHARLRRLRDIMTARAERRLHGEPGRRRPASTTGLIRAKWTVQRPSLDVEACCRSPRTSLCVGRRRPPSITPPSVSTPSTFSRSPRSRRRSGRTRRTAPTSCRSGACTRPP